MVHCFKINGRRFALDVQSGALHEADEATVQIIEAMGDSFNGALTNTFGLPQNEFSEIIGELRRLTEAGQLFTAEHENDTGMTVTEVSKANTPMSAGMREREPVIKALCLHIAHDCNLKCKYCFAGQGSYGDKSTRLMSAEVGRKAIDFLIANSGSRRNLEVDFFGGEPMLNFETVREIVTYGRAREKETGKKFRFTLTTNGTLLTPEHHAYINEVMDNVVLSIDGRPEVHDRMRSNKNGAGGYADVYPKLKALADSREHERYYVRGTYTRHNMDFAADVLHLADAGFKQISVEPVIGGQSSNYALRPEDLPALCDEYEKLAVALLDRRDIRFFHFEIDMEGGPCVAKRITGCGAGTEYLAVTPDGKLFPCHQFVGEKDFLMGDLDAGVTNKSVPERFARCHVYNKPECVSCWAKYYCSGGCAANAYHSNGDILKPDAVACALQKKRIECALFTAASKV